MSETENPLAVAQAATAPDYETGIPEHGAHDELQWLTQAASKIINRAVDEQPVSEQIGQLVEAYRSSGEGEQLISEASGVVALVGLRHVKESRLSARAVLEAAPKLVIDTANDDSVKAPDFVTQLVDSAEAFFTEAPETAEISEMTPPEAKPPVTDDETRFNRDVFNRLAVRAKQGDKHALNQLMVQGDIWARVVIATSQYFVPGGEWKDLRQEGLMGIMRAFNNYDPARGNFAPLADIAMRRAIWTGIKQANRGKHLALNTSASLEDDSFTDSTDGPRLSEVIPDKRVNLEALVLDRETLRALPDVIDRMTDLERTVVLMHADGYNYEEIAAVIDGNKKTVDNAVQRAWRKLAKANL